MYVSNRRSLGNRVLQSSSSVSLRQYGWESIEQELQLTDLLKEKLIADFFRFVRNCDLRQEALEAIEKIVDE